MRNNGKPHKGDINKTINKHRYESIYINQQKKKSSLKKANYRHKANQLAINKHQVKKKSMKEKS